MNRLQFRHIAEEDTMKAIDNLENKNSSGHDGISNKLLKSIRYELCKPLTLIINQMLSSGVFPETFKKSKIIPLYKRGILPYCLITGRFHFCQRFLKYLKE